MSVIEYKYNGETFFTHTSWFSERQINSWRNIPTQNKNLALYYGLATTFAIGVMERKRLAPYVRSFTAVGLGVGVFTLASSALFYSWFKAREEDELNNVVTKNQNLVTPLWQSKDSVVDLRSKDYQSFLNRRKGVYFFQKDVEKYSPSSILKSDKKFKETTLEKLSAYVAPSAQK